MKPEPLIAHEDEPTVEGGVHQPFTAFNQGFDAAGFGMSKLLNPYGPSTTEHAWWAYGHGMYFGLDPE